jgi:hypothetical protein
MYGRQGHRREHRHGDRREGAHMLENVIAKNAIERLRQ